MPSILLAGPRQSLSAAGQHVLSAPMLRFPLDFRFRLLTLAPQITVTDSAGSEVCYIKQKAFKLRESVTVFRDSTQGAILGKIEADRIIDWSARYTFQDAEGQPFGAVGRRGARSLWRSHYDIFDSATSNRASMSIQEESVMMRMLDNVLGEIPILGMFTGYFFNPSYAVVSAEGVLVAKLRKRASFLDKHFTLEKLADLTSEQELEILLSCLMMTLLERHRG
ncbi:MAG: hypothetical protein JWL59_2068 [Chthoniobacteraceae bacterium]|nr:hypothetical protein [Chthoniobacteraceae bacterium]